MANVRDLLAKKGAEFWSVPPDASLQQAIELLAEKDIGAVAVLDGICLVGILSERDCVRRAMLPEKSAAELRAGEVMTPTVIFARPDFTLRACLAIMTENHIRHLPVLEDGKLTGMITLGDVVKEIISRQMDNDQQQDDLIV
jgi:CBS domain-containing protein